MIFIPFIIAASIASAYGQYAAGKSAERQADAEAAWQQYNSQMAQRQADAEAQASAFEAQQQRKQAKALLSRQRSLIGTSGVTMEGSPLLVAEDTASELALENANIRMQGANRVAQYESQSILESSKAQASRSAASGYAKAGMMNAGTALISGIGDVAYKRYKMKGAVNA